MLKSKIFNFLMTVNLPVVPLIAMEIQQATHELKNEPKEVTSEEFLLYRQRFFDAIEKNDIAEVQDLLEQKKNCDYSEEYAPLLLWAVTDNKPVIVKLLIEAGAEVNANVYKGSSPAYAISSIGVLNLFIDAGVDLSLAVNPDDGSTLLMKASDKNSVSMIKELIELGEDVNARDLANNSVLARAVQNGAVEAVVLLEQAGAQDALAQDGKTAFHRARAHRALKARGNLCTIC
jgi:ankyrin repeat protein